MPEAPAVSVALCTFNGARFLGAQLATLQQQTVMPAEVVVCDDGSVDGTVVLLRAFQRRAPFPVSVTVNPRRLGPVRNFEQAAATCRQDIILFADQDDEWFPNHVATLAGALAAHPSAAYAFADATVIDDAGRTRGRSLWARVGFARARRERFASGDQFSELVRQNPVTGAAMAIRRRLWRIASPFSIHMIHDEWLALLGSAFGAGGVLVDATLLAYRVHAAQHQGVPAAHPLRRLQARRRSLQAWICGRVAAFEELGTRLRSLAGLQDPRVVDKALSVVGAKVTHLERRARAVGRPTVGRAHLVLGELLRGGYHRYSSGPRAAFLDVLGSQRPHGRL